MSELSKLIGQRIRNYRTKQKLSQERLAELSGCHPTYIGQVERGEKKASIETLVCLCNAMGVSPMVLLQDSLDPSVVSAEGSNRLANDIIKVLREHNLNDVAGK